MQKFDVITFEKNSNPGKVQTCIVGDDTGTIRATFWHSATDALADCNVGDVVQLTLVTSRENNGRAEISINNPENVTKSDANITVAQKPTDISVKKIAELEDDRQAAIVGVVVQAFRPSFYYSCPECKKRVRESEGKYACEIHGEVTAKLSYVCNVVIDDSTETIRCVCFNEQAEILTKLTPEDFAKLKDVNGEIKDLVLGKIVKVVGGVRYNAFSQRKEIVANSITTNVDPNSLK